MRPVSFFNKESHRQHVARPNLFWFSFFFFPLNQFRYLPSDQYILRRWVLRRGERAAGDTCVRDKRKCERICPWLDSLSFTMSSAIECCSVPKGYWRSTSLSTSLDKAWLLNSRRVEWLNVRYHCPAPELEQWIDCFYERMARSLKKNSGDIIFFSHSQEKSVKHQLPTHTMQNDPSFPVDLDRPFFPIDVFINAEWSLGPGSVNDTCDGLQLIVHRQFWLDLWSLQLCKGLTLDQLPSLACNSIFGTTHSACAASQDSLSIWFTSI